MENSNSIGYDELEKTKWMVSRIDYLHKSMIDSLETMEEKYESQGEKAISKLKEWRSILVTPFAGSIPILFGIKVSFQIDPSLFLWVLIGLVVTTATIFVIFTKIIGIFEDLFAYLDEVFSIQIGNLAKSHGYMISSVADLTKVRYDFVYNYFIFLMLLTCAVMVSLSNEFRKLAKHYEKFKDLKLRFEAEAKEFEKNLEVIPQYYEVFDSSKNIPEDLLDFVESNLAKYKTKK